MDYYRFFPQKYYEKTLALDPYQDGCYRRLIDEYMKNMLPLPDSDAALARICGISLSDWNAHACSMLRAYFKHKSGMLYIQTCEEELEFQAERSKFRTEKAKRAANKRWNKVNGLDATSMLGDARVKSRELIKKDNPPTPLKGGFASRRKSNGKSKWEIAGDEYRANLVNGGQSEVFESNSDHLLAATPIRENST